MVAHDKIYLYNAEAPLPSMQQQNNMQLIAQDQQPSVIKTSMYDNPQTSYATTGGIASHYDALSPTSLTADLSPQPDQQTLEQLQSTISELQNTITALKDKNKQQNEQHEKNKRNMKQYYDREIQQLKEEHVQQAQQVSNSNSVVQEYDNLKHVLMSKENMIAALTQEIEKLKIANTSSSNQRDEMFQKAAMQQKNEIMELRQKLTEAESVINTQSRSEAKTDEQIFKYQQEYTQVAKKCSMFEQEKNQLQMTLSGLNNELQDRTAQCKDLDMKLRKKQEETFSLSQQLNGMKNEFAKQKDIMLKMEGDYAELSMKRQQVEGESKELMLKYKADQNTLKQLLNENDSLKKELQLAKVCFFIVTQLICILTLVNSNRDKQSRQMEKLSTLHNNSCPSNLYFMMQLIYKIHDLLVKKKPWKRKLPC